MEAQLLAPPNVYEYMSTLDTSQQLSAVRPQTAERIEYADTLPKSPALGRSRSFSHWKSRRRLSISYSKISLSPRIDDVPHLTKTPWELARSKKHLTRRGPAARNAFPNTVFRNLPREVYDCIAEQLEQLYSHEEQKNTACYLKDLCSLCLTSRAWDRAATIQLYRKVWLLTIDDHKRRPKLRIQGISRLKLLRRTLREHRGLASSVKELELNHIRTLYDNASIEREEIVNQVASLIMACPNLERINGFHIPYTHAFDRLSYALSTRQKLKEKVWFLSESYMLEPDEEDFQDDPDTIYYHSSSDHTERFLQLNIQHPRLRTLVLHQQQPRISKPLTFRAIIGSIRHFPCLRHLCISGLSSTSFTNVTLNALPLNLHSLRLENLPGINDKGLQRFAKSDMSASLQNLKLVNLDINLVTISAFLSPHLANLKTFTLSQHRAPALPAPESPSTRIPTLWSPTLHSLHWEIRSQATLPAPTIQAPPNSPSLLPTVSDTEEPAATTTTTTTACTATSLLATSIRHKHFPALKRLRAPHDPQGLLQKLCKPSVSALLPCDMALLTSPAIRMFARSAAAPVGEGEKEDDGAGGGGGGDGDAAGAGAGAAEADGDEGAGGDCDKGTAPPRADSATSTPVAAESPSPFHGRFPASTTTSTDLSVSAANLPVTPAHSRLQAQSRILAARKKPLMQIRIYDAEGKLGGSKTVGGYFGSLGSPIEYDLRPDRGCDEGRWFAGLQDVVDRGQGTGDGCMRKDPVDAMSLF